MAFSELVGWIGTVLILAAYFLLSSRKMTSEDRSYQWLNVVGAVCVGVNAYAQRAWPVVFIEIAWSAIALVVIARISRKGRSA